MGPVKGIPAQFGVPGNISVIPQGIIMGKGWIVNFQNGRLAVPENAVGG